MSNAAKIYSTDQFTWTGSERTFSAEASDLGVRPEDSCFGPINGAVNNAIGLALTNPATGKTMDFQLYHVEFSKDNEILWWSLIQTPPADSNPCFVTIYND